MSGQADLDDVLNAIEKQTKAIEKQNQLLQRIVQIQESMLILIADDADPDSEPATYMDGRPVR